MVGSDQLSYYDWFAFFCVLNKYTSFTSFIIVVVFAPSINQQWNNTKSLEWLQRFAIRVEFSFVQDGSCFLKCWWYVTLARLLHGENFMTIFTTLSVIIWFSTGTLGIFATLVCFCYACGNIRHTEYGNDSHTIDFHTVL